jgi:hypothetical protein
VRRCAPILEFHVPLDVDALTALSDLAAIAESGVDARSLDDVVVPAWVSAPYDEHLTQPLLRPEAPELATPPAPLGLPLSEPRYAVPAPGLAVLVDGGAAAEAEPLHLDRLPADPDAPSAPAWPQHVKAGSAAVLALVASLVRRARHALARMLSRARELDVPARAATLPDGLRALVRDVVADLRDMGPRLGRLAVGTAAAAIVAGVLAPVLAPERPDGLTALAVLSSASPLAFDPDAGSAAGTTSTPSTSSTAGTDPAPAAPAPPARTAAVPSAGAGTGTGAPDGTAEGSAASEAGPLDVLRAALAFGGSDEASGTPAPVDPASGTAAVAGAAGAAGAGTPPARSGTGRRLVLGPDRAWAVAADDSVVRTWPLVRGRCLAPGTYRVRDGARATEGARAVVWAGRDGARSRPVHGVEAGTAPCGAAAPGPARWALTWAVPGSVVVVLP